MLATRDHPALAAQVGADARMRWHYESDGEKGARTHYAVRDNPAAPCGVERRDFPSARAARAFIATTCGFCGCTEPPNDNEDPGNWPACPQCKGV